jgi:hypothetical protein
MVRWMVRIVLVVAIVAASIVLAARWSDGPIGPLLGGPLESGVLVREPVADWGFASDIEEVELQLDGESVSRTTWILVQDGRAFIPASTEFPPGKRWHREALADGRATLRIADRRYPVVLIRVEDEAVGEAVRGVAERKYPQRPPGDVWLFEVRSRARD